MESGLNAEQESGLFALSYMLLARLVILKKYLQAYNCMPTRILSLTLVD